MFSSIMETVLVKFLGKYVDGIKNNMDVNIINGNVTVQKISLRPQFINELGLPFMLKYSHISKILINVPWTSLKQKPTTVTVQGLYVLLALKYDDMEQTHIDPKDRMKLIISRVKQQLKKKWQQKESNKSQTFAEKSVIRIIDNLVISIDEIHVRIQSVKRDWDFSFGLIMDRISSFTVNQYGQKTFYTRHFTNKEANPPLKKSFTCQRFQIYFNDKEDFFMSLQQGKNKQQTIKTLLAEPFASKSTTNSPVKSKGSIQKIPSTQWKQSYQMKILSRFTFDIIVEQKLSADQKYVVQVKGQLPKVVFQISDIQLSQIIVVLELIYEWVIDKEKNGRRANTFDEKTQQYFKSIVLKLAKQEKITDTQLKDLYNIALETPLSRLEGAADNLIKDYRIQKQMKKINKVANKDKSKQLMQKLFDRLQNQNQQIVQLFEHIVIELCIPQFKLSCMKEDQALIQVGLSYIKSDVKLVLTKQTYVSINVTEVFIKQASATQQKNLVILQKPQYSIQPFIQFGLTQAKKSPPVIKTTLKKRYFLLNQETLSHLITWVSRVKMNPPLVNFLDEQLNYSIYITQQIFWVLFSHGQSSLNLNIEIPIVGIQLSQLLELNFGTLSINRQQIDEYQIQVTERQSLRIQGDQIFGFSEGNKVTLLNIKPETVNVELCHLTLQNAPKVIKFVNEFIKNPLVAQFKKLDPIVEEEVIFQGKFILNQFATPQNMMLKGNYLRFFPSNQSIYLLRTKMYPIYKKGKYGLIFRQEVQKQINIVLMSSQKLMTTLFQNLKQHMLYICTIAQWKKYYQKFPYEIITEVSQVQKQQENVKLIDLNVHLKQADILIGQTKLGETILNLTQFKGIVNYKQYNTDAEGQIGGLNLNLGKDKLIQNLSIAVKYSYMQFMSLIMKVITLKLNVQNYNVIEQIVNISAQYALMVDNLIKTYKAKFGAPVVENGYIEERIANPEEDIQYLLESNVTLKLSNIQAYIIGFKNMIKNANLQISKYRNNPIPNIILKVRHIILMSCITLTGMEYASANNKIDMTLYNLVISLSFQLLVYQLTAGRGHLFLNSVLNLIQTRKSIQAKQNPDQVIQEKLTPTINLSLKGIKTRFKLTQEEQISTLIQNTTIKISKNETNKQMINLQVGWDKLGLLINNNVILQPISGKLSIKTNKQGLPVSLNANIEPIIINISVHKLIESALVMKISLQRIFNLQIVKSMMMEKLVAKNPGMNVKLIAPQLQFHVESVNIILFNHVDWQLIRLKIDSINLDTKKSKDNEIEISLQHLNPIFRIYEPVLQKTKISMSIKEGPQAYIKLQDVRFNISEELVKDMIQQLMITKQRVQQALKQSKFHAHEESSTQNELQKFKKIIVDMIVPQQLVDQAEEKAVVENVQEKNNTSVLIVKNCIKAEVLVQVRIDEQKTHLHFKDGDPPAQVVFKIRSQYRQSYQMVEKYKRVIIKLTLIHPIFSTQSLYFSVFLHKQACSYQKATFYDDTGLQVYSAIGLYIHQQPNASNYLLDIVSPFKIVNATSLNVNLNWVVGQDVLRKELNSGDFQWVSPWVPEKVTINPNSQHIYASSYQIMFAQPHSLYEISLNNSSGAEAHNYCCLTIERQLFQLAPDYSHQHVHSSVNRHLPIQPATISIKPTYFVINHFHSQIIVNETECKHKQKVPLYSMYREKNQPFFKLRLGDGSMHEVYLPKDGQSSSIELKLKNQNYVQISILRAKSLQGTNNPNSNQCIYHIYSQMQLLISFPKMEDISLTTNIYSTKYILKKQLQLNQVQFQHVHPSLISGHNEALTRDRFRFHTYSYILGELEKYLQIKSPNFYCKQVTLYPSYYGNDLFFYKQRQIQQSGEIKEKQPKPQEQILIKKFSINYQFTKINNEVTMFYVSILPKYYVLNQSNQQFNIDGQGVIKFNQRILVDSDSVQVVFVDTNSNWQMLHTNLSINLSQKKQIIFFRSVLFKEHEINQALKIKKRRRRSRSLVESQINELLGPNKTLANIGGSMDKKQELKKLQSIQQSQEEGDSRIVIDTSNIKIFQVLKHMGSYSATTFCIKQWQEWIDIHNNLNKSIIVATSYIYEGLQISMQTTVNPGEVGKHLYGTQDMPKIRFYILGKDQKLQLGVYEANMRLNDQIQLTFTSPQGSDVPPHSELIVMYEVRKKKGRKVILSFTNQTKNKKNQSLIIPAFLKISQSLKVTVESFNASIICGKQSQRKQLIRLCSRSIDLLLLVYPSGLYLFQAVCSLEIQAPHFPQLVVNIPNIQFYLQAVQSRFIQRVTLKIPKEITIFLTDKLLYEILNVAMRNVSQINQTQDVFNNDPKLGKGQDTDGFYTSSLNSVSVSEIHLKVTMKKVLIQGSQNQKKIVDMGLSIAELQKSGIKLSKIDIEQPINTKHLNGITKMYVMEIIVGCLGGMNLIGNPKQFMEQIEAGRMRGKPVIGFVGGVLAGTANSMSKILSTVSNSVSTLSMDYEYQRQRNQYYMTQPQGFVNGIKQGSKSLATSIKSGIVGLVQKPYSGAKQEGGLGFIKGSFQGLTGLIVKPVTGIMDAASMTIQGIRSASSYQKQNQIQYKGLEKPLYHRFKIIRPYDRVDELAYNSLARILRIDDRIETETVDIVQAVILQDEQGKPTQEVVLVTADKTYVLNFCQDLITMEFRNQKMVATGKFLEGVVLYLDQENNREGDVGQYQGDNDGGEVVFRVSSNAIKKQRLYWTLKSFISLYTQSKDSHQIPD